jgi:small GTP-binding protein
MSALNSLFPRMRLSKYRSMTIITKKICLLGDFNVGKTSLVRRFVEGKFSDRYLSTVGVKVSRKSVNIRTELNLHQVNLLVWDLEGNTKFKSITPSYLKGASGSIIVADLTRSDTLKNLNQHIELFLKVNPTAIIIIAMNKVDLLPEEKLNRLIENYSHNNSSQIVSMYKTSAKTGNNVAEMFDELAMAVTHSAIE